MAEYKAAIVDDSGLVVNVVILDSVNQWNPGPGLTVIELEEGSPVSFGWVWDGSNWLAPPIVEPSSDAPLGLVTGSHVTYTTTSETFVDVDDTKFVVSFTPTSSGSVEVRMKGWSSGTKSSPAYWCVQENGAPVAGSEQVVPAGLAGTLVNYTAVITDLEPGVEKTYSWAYRSGNGEISIVTLSSEIAAMGVWAK